MRIVVDARKIADFGIGTYIRGLLRGLAGLGHADEIVALAPPGSEIPDGVELAELSAPHYSVRELFAVGGAAARARAEVLHAPHYVTPFTGIPLVVTIHDLIHIHQPARNPLAPLYARTMLRRAVRKAARVLTVSEAVRRELVAELGADPSRVVVTPNGVEMPAAATAAKAEGVRFLAVGNDKPHKNLAALVAAFAHVRRELPEATLVLAGAPFARFAGRPGVETAGFVTTARLASLYAGATALVMPSLEEGFGLPALEAMSHGTAVITSRAQALVEVTGDAALHADAEDVHALAAAMLRVARDERLREQLASRGAARARQYTWRRCAELTRASYEAAVAAR